MSSRGGGEKNKLKEFNNLHIQKAVLNVEFNPLKPTIGLNLHDI